MNEFVLHSSSSLDELPQFPFPHRVVETPESAGLFKFSENKLQVFDGERWQHLDLALTLKSLRASPGGFASEPLARALGLIKAKPSSVIDASCGSCKDALQVWSWGQKVQAYERNPMVYLLLWDAIRRHEIPGLELHFGSATNLIAQNDQVIMYDPMFAHTDKKKSLARKEMQMFKDLVGPDTDQAQTLEALLSSGASRVVIKRPSKLKPLPKPNHSFEGKTIRFDVYLAK
ncbi:MAG: hypothetical protein CME71_08015 [Halobacteriovorax sp.]|nr:hypothetical protein [Halobacteriovorax sp.]